MKAHPIICPSGYLAGVVNKQEPNPMPVQGFLPLINDDEYTRIDFRLASPDEP